MWLFYDIANLVRSVGDLCTTAYYNTRGIPLLGNTIGSFFYGAASFCYNLTGMLRNVGDWVDDISRDIGKILPWDRILDRLYLAFPWLRDPGGYFREQILDRLYLLFPWLRDPIGYTWQWIQDRLYLLFPWLRDPIGYTWQWIQDKLYLLFPWLRDPVGYTKVAVQDWLRFWLWDFIELNGERLLNVLGRVIERLW